MARKRPRPDGSGHSRHVGRRRAPDRVAGLQPMAGRSDGKKLMPQGPSEGEGRSAAAAGGGAPAALEGSGNLRTAGPEWSRLRLRQSAHLRDMLAETTFSVAQLIQPIFVVEGMEGAEPIPGLGQNARHGT